MKYTKTQLDKFKKMPWKVLEKQIISDLGKAKSQSIRQPMGDAYTAKNTSMKTDNSITSQPQGKDLTIAFLLLLLISAIWAIWFLFATYPILNVWGQN